MADFQQWLPGVDDYFHRHPTAPDAGSALGLIGPRVEPAVTALSIDRQGRPNAHQELSAPFTDHPVETKGIAQIGVSPLVE
jgi:hypothetical protein